jgi:hypothetical protein
MKVAELRIFLIISKGMGNNLNGGAREGNRGAGGAS